MKKIGIALGTGGAKGLSHIGVLEILENNDLIPSEIAGCSIGAIIGALYASGLSIRRLKEISLHFSFIQTLQLFDFTNPKEGGIVKGKLVEELLDSILPIKKFEDLKIPFKCVATDIIKGKPVIYDKGDLVPAIRASISIPGFFVPYEYQGRTLVDGGVVNPVPVNLLEKSDYKIAVVVEDYALLKDISEKTRHFEKKINSLLNNKIFPKFDIIPKILNKRLHKKHKTIDVLSNTFNMIFNELANFNLDDYKPDLIIRPDVKHIPVLAFYLGKKSYKKGLKAGRTAIAGIEFDVSIEEKFPAKFFSFIKKLLRL